MAGQRKKGQDQKLSGAEQTVLSVVRQYKTQSEQSVRKARLEKSARNWDLYMGLQDFGYKQPGQSREFLPKTAEAVEQFCGFIERALAKFEDWWLGPGGEREGGAWRI